jgi:L-serine dehydratase
MPGTWPGGAAGRQRGNAAGGRMVTAPANGAAGIIPAILHYCRQVIDSFSDDGVIRFLLAAGAIGVADQGERVNLRCRSGLPGRDGLGPMAAAGLAEMLGATPEQAENAAEIGIEHNLGLTCDPIGGLVQISYIARNAVGSINAITAALMALHGDRQHHPGAIALGQPISASALPQASSPAADGIPAPPSAER